MPHEIVYKASDRVADVIASLGRTEDIVFSPSGRRIGIAGFADNRITVFDLEIDAGLTRPHVAVVGGVVMRCSAVKQPHGVDFIDDQTLIVASRGAGIAIVSIPPTRPEVPEHEVTPEISCPLGDRDLIGMPGSVRVVRHNRQPGAILVCDNTKHVITEYRLDHGLLDVETGRVLLSEYIDLPDGLNASANGRWLAISNHAVSLVLIFNADGALSTETEPVGILRGVTYPHGVCFTKNGLHLLVAEAGGPYIHLFDGTPDWRGVREPIATFKIMADDTFQRGHINPEEGGPKGLDIDPANNVLAISSECLPLAFYDLSGLLATSPAGQVGGDEAMRSFRYELNRLRRYKALSSHNERLQGNMRTLHYVYNSRSWKITAPLRRLDSLLRRRKQF